MSTLIVTPTPEVFSQVPELAESFQTFQEKRLEEEIIPRLGEIFVKHNAFDHFGLSMTHRHFAMTSEEILVETTRKDKSMSVSLPWNLDKEFSASPSDETLWTSYQMNNCERKFIAPHNWCFHEGQLLPFEFIATDDPTLLQPSPEFVHDLYNVLKEYGVERYVGIRRLRNLNLGNAWETTPEGIRANVLVYGEKPENLNMDDMIRVLWAFDEKGDLKQATDFCVICLLCWSCKNKN